MKKKRNEHGRPKHRLIFAILVIIVFFYGIAVGRFRIFPYKPVNYLYDRTIKKLFKTETVRNGSWQKARKSTPDNEGDSEGNARKMLFALPYLKGYKNAPKDVGVTVYNKDKTFNGLNFWVSGHEPSAFLMDMKGNVLHEWNMKYEEVWANRHDLDVPEIHKTFWRRAHLFDNGDILAIFEGIGIIKLDKDSNLLWANPCKAHHDVYVHENGNIYVLTSRWIRTHNRIKLSGPILEDFITVLSPEGKLIKSVSLIDCFLNSEYTSMLNELKNANRVLLLHKLRRMSDPLHTNTIEMLDGAITENHPIFKKGQFLVSFRNINTIALVDLDKEAITWALSGMWTTQHQPTLLPDGNLLLFDNIAGYRKSRVIEFDPLSHEIVWAYEGTENRKLHSRLLGSNQRLPNGNTLITESDYGRAIEVTHDKEIVWEFFNPYRAGKDNELIATLLEIIRIPPGRIDCTGNIKGGCFKSE